MTPYYFFKFPLDSSHTSYWKRTINIIKIFQKTVTYQISLRTFPYSYKITIITFHIVSVLHIFLIIFVLYLLRMILKPNSNTFSETPSLDNNKWASLIKQKPERAASQPFLIHHNLFVYYLCISSNNSFGRLTYGMGFKSI